MNSELQKRLYDMEVMPPAAVWEKLSLDIDEINTDNPIAKKVLDAALTPPATAWRNISIAIGAEEKKEPVKRGVVINFKRMAAAAIFIGIVITAWFVFRNNKRNDTLAGTQNSIETKTSTDTNSKNEKKSENTQEQDLSRGVFIPETNSETISNSKRNKFEASRNNKIYAAAQTSNFQYASLNSETPGGNSFGQSIDDLSLVTSDQNYLTMVNANGRLVKIPAQFANLAPHLQNKPISEDYYEVMFGEGEYWKETLNEWRKKVASLPTSSGDAFTSFIELLKTVQDK
ncbi:MAG: hypothetical protein E6H08_04955 [Bacteroidetes bacterium]|nr:MAG: hypothetical protein E6H08_04955 [Bacteroidota bacterium]